MLYVIRLTQQNTHKSFIDRRLWLQYDGAAMCYIDEYVFVLTILSLGYLLLYGAL